MGKYLTVLVFILILLIFDSVATYSQSWTNPVNVSSAGSNDNPSLAISTDGTLHCVWSHAKGAYLSTLFYSKSTDNGTTWSEPLDITANYNKWLGSANIVCDSFNNLYVSYDYDLFNYTQTKVFYKKFNGFSWGDSIRLSGALNGVWNNRLTIDQNNKVYCFWYGGISSGISYICIENGIAGNIINPYSTQGKQIRLSKATCDNSNNVHCIGTVYNPSNPSDFPQSIYFNSVNGDWSDIQLLTSVRTTLDNDLSLNKAGIPDFVFAVITDPFNDGH